MKQRHHISGVWYIFFAFFFLFPLFNKTLAATVTGKVYKLDGTTALQNAEVMIHTSTWSSQQWATTDSNGSFTFSSVATGNYVLEFRPPWDSQGLVTPDSRSFTIAAANETHYFDGDSNNENCTGTPCHTKITFQSANNTISGRVTNSAGSGVTARVEAYKEMGMGWMYVQTNASGNYSLSVGAGKWMVSPRPVYGNDPSQVNWTYNKPPTRVSFDNNNSPGATKTTNFSVQTADCTISGTVKDPNGNVLADINQYVYVSVWSREGGGNGANVQSDGTFSFKVPQGSYMLTVNTWHQSYGGPAGVSISVSDANSDGTCDGYAAGTLRLTAKNSTITGKVVNSSGNAVQNVSINAWLMNGSGWANATTDASGNYTLTVSAGTWTVSIMTDPGMMSGGYGQNQTTYIYDGNPLQVTVAANATSSSNNFTIKVADATINGQIVDSSGNVLTTLEMGYVYVENGTASTGIGPRMYSTIGAPVQNGTFTLKVPAGTYNVNIGLPSGVGYCAASSKQVTLTAGGSASSQITVTQANGTISGSLKKNSDSGDTVTGVAAEIFGNSGTTNYAMASVNTTDGSYSMSVCPGDWYLGYWIDASLGYLSQPPSNNKVTVVANQTTTKHIIIKQADATITGTVTDPTGAAMSGVWVMLDTRSNDTAGSFSRDNFFSNGDVTNASGVYSISVPSGTTYYVEAHYPNSSYLNPSRVSVTPTTSQTATVNLQFRQSNATISGQVTQSASARSSAYVSAWSEDGSFSTTTSDASGNYSLSVTAGTNWHLKAMYESGTSFARSNETVVSPSSGSNTKNLDLANSGSMPDSVTSSFSASNQKTITLSDGATITIPAGALASSGNVTVVATPKAQLPNQSLASPINFGYTLTALDSNGAEVTSNFNSNVTIVIPYTEADLTALGVTEDDLLAGYWDTSTNSWKAANNISIDKDSNTVTITINHFTDFAVFTAGKKSTSSSSTSTSSTSSSSSSSYSSGTPKTPTILANQGTVFYKEQSTITVTEGTLPWDGYASLNITQKKQPVTFGSYWQVTDMYEMWFRSFFNDAKILSPNKPSLISMKYTKSQLGNLPEASLRLAYSPDNGITWKVFLNSVVDTKNRTVAGIGKLGGHYILVAGFDTDTEKKEESASKDAQLQDLKPDINSTPDTQQEKAEDALSPKQPSQKLSFFKRILQRLQSFFFRKKL